MPHQTGPIYWQAWSVARYSFKTWAVSRDQPIFDFDFTSGPFADRLVENMPHGPFRQPLFIGIGASDEVVLTSILDIYVASLCASDQPLEYHTYPDKIHMGVLDDDDSPLPVDLEQWTRGRLAGLPPEDTCGL